MAKATKRPAEEAAGTPEESKPKAKRTKKPQPCRILHATEFEAPGKDGSVKTLTADQYAQLLTKRDELRSNDPKGELEELETLISSIEPTKFVRLRGAHEDITETTKAESMVNKVLEEHQVSGWLGIFKLAKTLPAVRTTVVTKTTVQYD